MEVLIKREMALKALRDATLSVKGFRFGKTILSEYSKQVREGYIDILKDLPSANDEIVRHGCWVTEGKTIKGTPIRKCSYCKTKRSGRPMTAFCPDCGAMMDLDISSLDKNCDLE